MLGLVQMKIQRGVGSGNITINEIDPAKSIILISSSLYTNAMATGTVQWLACSATIVNATTINCGTTLAWTVIEFGGAV